jgi:hypothetical protein
MSSLLVRCPAKTVHAFLFSFMLAIAFPFHPQKFDIEQSEE